MTVQYSHDVATGTRMFGNYMKLLFKWKGSIYKLVLPDLALYLVIYYSVNFVYRFGLEGLPDGDGKKKFFESLVLYCETVSRHFPLQFLLGFYVSTLVTRWWEQFMSIPYPDSIALLVATSVHGHDERGRMMRRTLLRYVNLSQIFCFSWISQQAKTRFPTMDHIVEAGMLLPHEKIIIDRLNEKMEGCNYYVPIVWACAIVTRAKREGRVRDEISLYHLIKEMCKYRHMLGDLLNYDWVCVPLVYTQVATLATYVYFLSCILGKQVVAANGQGDIFVPVFHFLEFFFLMGWLKVAETLVNPFGNDDDDFEVNWMLDRNITVSYMIVDEMNTEFPEMVKDAFWETVVPDEMYYTEDALKFKTEGYGGSAAALQEAQGDVPKEVEVVPRVVSFTSLGAKRRQSVAFILPGPRANSIVSDEEVLTYFERSRVQKYRDSDVGLIEEE